MDALLSKTLLAIAESEAELLAKFGELFRRGEVDQIMLEAAGEGGSTTLEERCEGVEVA